MPLDYTCNNKSVKLTNFVVTERCIDYYGYVALKMASSRKGQKELLHIVKFMLCLSGRIRETQKYLRRARH
jgi:hypothetical protein